MVRQERDANIYIRRNATASLTMEQQKCTEEDVGSERGVIFYTQQCAKIH